MKLPYIWRTRNLDQSPLAMAEWIEILVYRLPARLFPSPLAMAEWIEIDLQKELYQVFKSPLAMAEWIEIFSGTFLFRDRIVSASDGGVD